MRRPRVLLQTSIVFAPDDWHAGRFSLLVEELGRSADVVARDRKPGADGVDPVIAGLNRGSFDQVWLMAVDGGDASGPAEIAALNRFQKEGGGLLTARDHADMGRWMRALEGVGPANFFHDATCREPDPERCSPDDRGT